MGFNYGLEKKKFDAEWTRLRAEYTAAGMDEASIQIMYEYDLKAFNRRRADAMHEQSLDGMRDCHFEDVSDDRSPLLMKFESVLATKDDYFATGRFAWIEAISNEELYARLSSLTDDDKELLTLFAMEGLSKREIAQRRNISEQAVGQKMKRLRKFLFGV